MRYPLTEEAASNPQRYARYYDREAREEEFSKARSAIRKGKRVMRMMPQEMWGPYQGSCANADGMDASYFPETAVMA